MNITAGPDLEPGESEGAGNCECVRLPYRHLCNEIKTPSRSVPPGRGDSGERRLSLAARAECAQAQGAERHSLNSWFMSACWPGAARKSAGSISHRSAIQSLPQNKGPEGPQVCQGRGLDQSRSGGPSPIRHRAKDAPSCLLVTLSAAHRGNMGNSTTPQLQAGQCEGKESPPVEH
ncbi:hypothetical protein JZ751_015911 [Albula glossodonta]|uniref:Uncharacterized protein n=1 Tax=Albula glossodonta TaxID=121402 RepID=A0A8T2MM69_9TELE|nr:hypothetical protein JZ751_015911 [Albula glossodonta]